MALTLAQYDAINSQIAFHRGVVEGGQLSVSLSDDMAEFKQTLIGLEPGPKRVE